jgi:protein-S-isoprenylcysteine O-methyltransferase Ste14
MMEAQYGMWSVAILNAAIFILFAFSFFKPRSRRDWRAFGTFSAFLVALFAEMYGFPLTIYLLSGWLQSAFPQIDWLTHDAGHLLEMMFGWEANPHFGPCHLPSFALIGGGFLLLSASWRVLYAAQTTGRLAIEGPYARVRHPQYVAFVLIMFGFLVQWPTLLTLGMFPVLVWMYVRLAYREEREAVATFGDAYRRYAERCLHSSRGSPAPARALRRDPAGSETGKRNQADDGKLPSIAGARSRSMPSNRMSPGRARVCSAERRPRSSPALSLAPSR